MTSTEGVESRANLSQISSSVTMPHASPSVSPKTKVNLNQEYDVEANVEVPHNDADHFEVHPDTNAIATTCEVSSDDGRFGYIKSSMQSLLIIYVQPFILGLSLSSSTLYFFYELMNNYRLSNQTVGVFLSISYIMRVLSSSWGRWMPKTCAFSCCFAALFGYYLIFRSIPRDTVPDSLQYVHSDRNLHLFVLGTTLTQSTEGLANSLPILMQRMQKNKPMKNTKQLAAKLKQSYSTTQIAQILSFLLTGTLYHNYALDGIATMGTVLLFLQLSFFFTFCILDVFAHQTNHQSSPSTTVSVGTFSWNSTKSALQVRRRTFKSDMSSIHRSMSNNHSHIHDIETLITRQRYLIMLCTYGRSLSVTTAWTTAAIIMDHDFHFNFIVIGVIFACASITDFIVSLVFMRSDTHQFFVETFPSPRDVIYCISGITFGLVCMAIPTFITYLCGFLIMCAFNAILKWIVLNLQGTSGNLATNEFSFMCFRRVVMVITIYLIPLLYDIHSRLPMILGIGHVVLGSSIFFIVLLRMKMKEDDSNDMTGMVEHNLSTKNEISIKTSTPNASSLPPSFDFSETVLLTELIMGKDV